MQLASPGGPNTRTLHFREHWEREIPSLQDLILGKFVKIYEKFFIDHRKFRPQSPVAFLRNRTEPPRAISGGRIFQKFSQIFRSTSKNVPLTTSTKKWKAEFGVISHMRDDIRVDKQRQQRRRDRSLPKSWTRSTLRGTEMASRMNPWRGGPFASRIRVLTLLPTRPCFLLHVAGNVHSSPSPDVPGQRGQAHPGKIIDLCSSRIGCHRLHTSIQHTNTKPSGWSSSSRALILRNMSSTTGASWNENEEKPLGLRASRWGPWRVSDFFFPRQFCTKTICVLS